MIEVWSRLWPSTVVGKRSYQNTLVRLSESFQTYESRTDSSGRHGWIRVLRESRQTRLWASVSLWSGDQDTPNHCIVKVERRAVVCRQNANAAGLAYGEWANCRKFEVLKSAGYLSARMQVLVPATTSDTDLCHLEGFCSYEGTIQAACCQSYR